MRHDDGRACVLPKRLVQPSHLLGVDDGVIAIRSQENVVDDDDIPAADLVCMISALVAKEVEKPLFAPESLRPGGCAVFLAPSPRVMIADGVKALNVGVVPAGLCEDIPLRSGAGFRLRVGIHDQIAAKQQCGGFVLLLHDVVKAEGETFGRAELRLNVGVGQVDDAG